MQAIRKNEDKIRIVLNKVRLPATMLNMKDLLSIEKVKGKGRHDDPPTNNARV